MSGSNEAIETALISDHLHKNSAKKTIDSGFLSCENLSENFATDNEPPYEEIPEPEVKIPEENMKVDSGICCVSEDFSKLKLINPSINDLSATKDETSIRVSSIDKDCCRFYEQDEEGDTYLHAAIAQRFSKIALNLIRGAPTSNYLDIANNEGFTPLHLAVATDQWRIARWLIVAGAKTGLRNLRGESPLHLAARLGSVNCVRSIMEPVHCQEMSFLNLKYRVSNHKQVDLDQWDYEGQTCIHVAALHNHIDVLRLLIWHGANVNAKEGKGGYTALHYAIENQNERLAYFLLTECEKLDTEVTTYAGRSVLQLGLPVNRHLMNVLLSRGVASPYSSDDESLENSEDEMIYDNSPIYLPQLVNGCA